MPTTPRHRADQRARTVLDHALARVEQSARAAHAAGPAAALAGITALGGGFGDAAAVHVQTTGMTVPAATVVGQRLDTDGAGAYWPRLQLACPQGTTAQYRYRDHLLDAGDPWHDWRAWADVDAAGWTGAGTAIDLIGRQAEAQYETRCTVHAWQGQTVASETITMTRTA